MNTYIPHDAKLDSYNKEGELVYTKTNYTGTKRNDEVTWYKNPGTNSTLRDSIFVDRKGKKYREREITTVTESETGMTTQITDEDGKVLSTDELTNTEDGWSRIVHHPQNLVQKERQSNTVKELDGTTKADVMTFDRVEIDPNKENGDVAPYITATRDKLIRTKRGKHDFEERAVNGIVTDYEYNVHMKFTAHDVDATTYEIKKNAESRSVATQITKTQTNQDGIRLVTERIQSSTDLGTYRTMTYGGQGWVTTDAKEQVARALEIFFGADGAAQHDDKFDEEYCKIDYDKIKYLQHFATYQEDMIGVVPQLKSLCFIFVDEDKQAHLKVCGDIVYDVDNNLGHMNVECCYCTYGTELSHAFTEHYHVDPSSEVLADMSRAAYLTRKLSDKKMQAAELASRLTKTSDTIMSESKRVIRSVFD